MSVGYEKYSEYYHFTQVGKGQMQFLRSKPDPFHPNNLSEGRLADYYEPEKIWKNKIYNILKKLGGKVYWYYHTTEGKPEISKKPQNKLVALPDVLRKYNGKNGFLTQSAAKFVGEGITDDFYNF